MAADAARQAGLLVPGGRDRARARGGRVGDRHAVFGGPHRTHGHPAILHTGAPAGPPPAPSGPAGCNMLWSRQHHHVVLVTPDPAEPQPPVGDELIARVSGENLHAAQLRQCGDLGRERSLRASGRAGEQHDRLPVPSACGQQLLREVLWREALPARLGDAVSTVHVNDERRPVPVKQRRGRQHARVRAVVHHQAVLRAEHLAGEVLKSLRHYRRQAELLVSALVDQLDLGLGLLVNELERVPALLADDRGPLLVPLLEGRRLVVVEPHQALDVAGPGQGLLDVRREGGGRHREFLPGPARPGRG